MGEVYLALDTKLNRKVALKILPADVSSNQDRMRRFVQEAKAASALNHPNIITIHEIDETDSSQFIATEFIDGETLRERISSAPMKLGEVLDVATQISGALSAAHAAGIVHRDVKPENVMLRRDGILKVLDFGLAKLTANESADIDTEGPTKTLFRTDPGTVFGTAVYMSPEQARGTPVDARTDIFSLGVVVYEMVAGCLPFEGSTSTEVLASILSEKEPQPLARYSRQVPAELERIVSKALRKNSDERYQTIKDMLLDLKSLKQELEFSAKLEQSTPSAAGNKAIDDDANDPRYIGELGERPDETQTFSEQEREVVKNTGQFPLQITSPRFAFSKTAVALSAVGLISILALAAWFLFRQKAAETSPSTIRSIAVLPFKPFECR